METNKLKADFQLMGTTIIFLQVSNNFIHIENLQELEKKFNVEYEILNITTDADNHFAKIQIHINVQIDSAESETMEVELILEGAFIATSEMPVEVFKEFVNLNGCATLYSIARSIIISITSQTCSGGQIILPMINLSKLEEKNPDDNDSKN